MLTKRTILTVALVGTCVVAGTGAAYAMTQAAATTLPAGLTASIDVVSVNGSGCPAGSASVRLAPDGSAFRIVLSDYQASAGGGASATSLRKNCQISLNVHRPAGFTYALAATDYSGWLDLGAGDTATLSVSSYFQGSANTTRTSHVFTGPTWSAYQYSDVREPAATEYLPCDVDHNLTINTSLLIAAGTPTASTTSSISLESMFGSAGAGYLTWIPCPGSTPAPSDSASTTASPTPSDSAMPAATPTPSDSASASASASAASSVAPGSPSAAPPAAPSESSTPAPSSSVISSPSDNGAPTIIDSPTASP